MIWSGLSTADQAGALAAFLLTLCVFSYWLRDNALFRLAIHIFIGTAAGYATIVIWYNVLWPLLFLPLVSGGGSANSSWLVILLTIVPLILGLLLLLRLSSRLAGPGRLTLAYLVGVGAALAVGGAVSGTILPQALASINLFDASSLQAEGSDRWITVLNRGTVLIGTLTSLAYFHFGARRKAGQNRSDLAKTDDRGINQSPSRPVWIEEAAGVGQAFIAVTLGALFAGVYAAALAALVERWDFIIGLIQSLLEG